MNILITGGTSALGQAVVRLLAEQRHRVAFTYCSNGALAQQLCMQCPTATAHPLDLTSAASIQALTELVPSLGVQVLIHNAHVGRPLGTHFHRTPVEHFAQSYAANVESVVRLTQACIAAMRRNKAGRIVTVGSLATRHTPPGYSVYVMTKACLQQLALSWHSEYAHLGIQSTVVLPDFMPTPLHGELLDHLSQQQLARDGRLLTVDEVARVVLGAAVGEFKTEHIVTA